MEVSIFEAVGLPEGTILSVRAGSTRRQAPMPLQGPLRFPNLPFNAKQFKVDVMQTLGSSKVDINANKELESYTVGVDIGNGQHARVGFTVREQPSLCGKRAYELKQVDKNPDGIMEEPQPAQLPPEKAQAALDSRAYAREHNIPNLVQEMLQHVLREKPDDPFMVMSEYFRRKGVEMGEQGEGLKNLPPLQSNPAPAWQQSAEPSPRAPIQQQPQHTAAPAYTSVNTTTPAYTAAPASTGAPSPHHSAAPAPYSHSAAPAPHYAAAPAPHYAAAPGPTASGRAMPSGSDMANTEAMINSLDPDRQAAQRKLQSQMTYPGEYYVPNIPGEDQHDVHRGAYGDHLPSPSEFPEDPAAHIKAPPPPPGVDPGAPLPPPRHYVAPQQAGAQPQPLPAAHHGNPMQERGLPPVSESMYAQKAAPPPPGAGAPSPRGLVSQTTRPLFDKLDKNRDGYLDRNEFAMGFGQGSVGATYETTRPRDTSDPERVQLEADHLSLQSEKAALLRELEILSVQQAKQQQPGGRP